VSLAYTHVFQDLLVSHRSKCVLHVRAELHRGGMMDASQQQHVQRIVEAIQVLS
jgi:hypothetical protein